MRNDRAKAAWRSTSTTSRFAGELVDRVYAEWRNERKIEHSLRNLIEGARTS
jgi:hypothetical protein